MPPRAICGPRVGVLRYAALMTWSGPSSADWCHRASSLLHSNGGQRESDGAIVLMTAGRAPATGKGPDFGHAGSGAKREGMAGTAQPNYPDGHMPVVKVRQLQNRLWAAAKQSRERRFHALYNRAWAEHGTGELVRYADDYVVLCKSRDEAEQAHRLPSELMGELGLSLHPDKTRAVDLRSGREGFDFLGCHFHARMSGKQWEQRRIVRYYLQRWPSLRSMKRARARVKALTGRSQVGMELQDVIERLNLFLRGWGNYFRTGNAATKFVSLDRYVAWRLHRLLVKKRGRNLRAARQTAGRVPGSTTRACTN